MLIRSATTVDIPALLALDRSTSTAAHWSKRQYEIVLGSNEPKRVALIIEDDSAPQGFLVAKIIDEEWEIENIAISPKVQRQGLASRLFQEVLTYARKHVAKIIFLEVRESNIAARSLYEKFSFTPAGRRKNYYSNPTEDALVYHILL